MEEPVEQIVEHLMAAADALPESVDREQFEAYMDEGMFEHAWEALRQAASEVDVPFGFWVEMSKAGDLLGMK